MTSFNRDIKEAVPKLLAMARKMTWNKIPDNCKFILSKIENSTENGHRQRVRRKMENDKKIPVSLRTALAVLYEKYEDLYDVNVEIFKVKKDITIVDVRYFLKSSFDKDYQQVVKNKPPMLHCKVEIPFWISERNQKFDINWVNKEWLNKMMIFMIRVKALLGFKL